MTKVLSIVSAGYRATVEEQDDTVLWFSHMCRKSDLDVSVLLCGTAVNYAVSGQDATGLGFGHATVDHPPALDDDLSALIADGAEVRYVSDDLTALGVSESRLIDGVTPVKRSELGGLFAEYDQVWHW